MRLAARGLRDLDDGEQAISDAAELAQIRRQAMKVHVMSLGFSAALTALVYFLPF